MAEPVYRACEILAQMLLRATGTRITYVGEEHIPERGGAVIAQRHYAHPAGERWVRRRHPGEAARMDAEDTAARAAGRGPRQTR